MSLYLQAAVGDGRYLLEAAWIVEVQPVVETIEPVRWQGEAARCVDLREVFGEERAVPGYCVLFAQNADQPAALLVDAVEGLVEIGDWELLPLPPIGPLGALIDAVSTTLARERPMLRLRGERVLGLTAGREIAADADRG